MMPKTLYGERTLLNTLVRAFTAAATVRTITTGAAAFSTTSAASSFLSKNRQQRSLFIGEERGNLALSNLRQLPYTGFGRTTGTTSSERIIRTMMSVPTSSARPDSDSGESSSSKKSNDGNNGDRCRLKALCVATLRACEAVTPAVDALYRSISKDNDDKNTNNSRSKTTKIKTKADDSIFTIADGLVQYLLAETLLLSVVRDIVGEEDCAVNLTTKPYRIDDFVVPFEFEKIIEQAILGVTSARDGLLQQQDLDTNADALTTTTAAALYPSLTAFIDPIDGTREFSTQKGEQCTICVGFADTETGKPVAGVVYRPLSEPKPTWAAGAESEGYVSSELATGTANDNNDDDDKKGSLLTTNGSISPFLESLIEELDYERTPSGGAGNKMLMLLEGKGTAYIQDRGVSRWDTCAAQAVLEANGGILCRLDRFLEENSNSDNDIRNGYTYRSTEENLDFSPGQARLTKYNAAEGIDINGKKNVNGMVGKPSDVKPYANLCGLLAIGKARNNSQGKAQIFDALKRASLSAPPAYD